MLAVPAIDPNHPSTGASGAGGLISAMGTPHSAEASRADKRATHIGSMYLDYAEKQAGRRIPMKMTDWVTKLDAFLQFDDAAACAACCIGSEVSTSGRQASRCRANLPTAQYRAWCGSTKQKMNRTHHRRAETNLAPHLF